MPSVLSTVSAASFASITITDVQPMGFTPGETRELQVTVKNNGGRDAKDIRLAFQGTEILSLVGPTVLHISTLNSWSSKEVPVTIHVKEEAPNGIYSVPVSVTWREYYFDPQKGYVTDPEEKTALLGISFNVQGSVVLNVGDITTDPTDIRPGSENVEIRAFIENSGEAAAKDIDVQLLLEDGSFTASWSGTDRSYLGRLNSGEKSEAVFHLDLLESTTSGQLSIPLRISYKDTSGQDYEVLRELVIQVKPKPDFEIVSYATEPASIGLGSTGVALSMTVRNIGSEDAESASVRMTGEADVPFDYDVKSDFVGNVDIGDEGEAIVKFDVDDDAVPRVYPIGIEIRCTGDRDLGDDNVYIFNKELKVEVSPGSSQKGGFSLPGFEALLSALALVLVVILLGTRRIRI
ncbi:MAG: COG1361 S-layer family protein [Methanomicrobia archaeon]|nr:COG1361 S-layer family protein [Methanomicrobia archaeon]